ncbi:acyltransferase family protein [Mycobacteroides chelonae]|uniref:acyltransferase family protein n=1 Tax=Mycobacteroides chelonae TaxID=1774 RepID=UPI001C2C6D3D|nr:acyltransferase [Mycobacteroides chelonae]MBV0918697.1 acyltransferase [Mycobacteroides chelonae]
MSRRSVAAYECFLATRKFGALDGLRALSVLAVIWHHTSGTPGPRISHSGFMGVDFFFAISGFLITTLLMRERDRTADISLRNFYARRALRIFPLYYAVLALYVLLVFATERDTPKGEQFFRNLPAFLTYTVNWFVDLSAGTSVPFYFSWSLSTEEQFYVLWPPLLAGALLLGKGRIGPPLAVLFILIAVSVGAGMFLDTRVLPWRILASLSLPILLGAASAIVVNTRRGYAGVSAVLGWWWSAPAVFAAMIGALWFGAPPWSIQVIMVTAVTAVTIREDTLMHPVLTWRPLAFIGVISYGVYLMHMLCANIVRRVVHEEQGLALCAGTTVLVVAVAYVSFRYFETPLLRIKRRFESPAERSGDELSRTANQLPVRAGRRHR